MAEARSESSSRVAFLRASVMANENNADEKEIFSESEESCDGTVTMIE
jgi:hypothetical protein